MNAQQLKKFNAWALAAFEQMADDKADGVAQIACATESDWQQVDRQNAAGMAQLEQHDAPAGVQKERKPRKPFPDPYAARRERQKQLFG